MTNKYSLKAFKDSQLIVRSPGRINLIGEHTDYNSGLCLPAAISQSIYFGIQNSEQMFINSLDRDESCNEFKGFYDWEVYFKGVIDLLNLEGYFIPNFKLIFGGNLPVGAGLSSSSSLVCGFIYTLNEFFSLGIDKKRLTELSVIAERANGLLGGMMDQIIIMNGVKNHALLIDCSSWKFNQIPILLSDMTWLIINTNVTHKLVDSDYNNRSLACQHIRKKLLHNQIIQSNISELNIEQVKLFNLILDPSELRLLEYVLEENKRVLEFVNELKNNNAYALGQLLLQGHQGLKDKYKVSCEELDLLIKFADEDPQCYGARMMGGGFGGSTIHLLNNRYIQDYSLRISEYYKSTFGFNPNIFEAQIVDGVQITLI